MRNTRIREELTPLVASAPGPLVVGLLLAFVGYARSTKKSAPRVDLAELRST